MRPVMIPTTDVNSETAVVTAWHVADRAPVEAGQLVAEVETSKAVLDVATPETGHLLRGAVKGEQVSLHEPLAYVFATRAALEEHAARRVVTVPAAASVRATVPAIRRAEELGVELAGLGNGALVTVKMVETAARNGAGAAPVNLPLPLEAPSGVERVAVIGAGLGATQVIDIFAGHMPCRQQAVAIVDDDRSRWTERVAGVPVVGGTEQLQSLFADGWFDSAVIAIGSSVAARARFRELCRELGIPLTNAIDRTARICSGVAMGVGNIICAFCHVGVGTHVGDNNVLSAYSSFDHHSVLGSDITTGPGCKTSGVVTIGNRVRMGTGIFVEPHVQIGDGVQVASGAVIVKSVPAGHAVKRRVVTTTTVPIRT
jgi:acetyltransferase-like isoleucine patch superfamily enzyme